MTQDDLNNFLRQFPDSKQATFRQLDKLLEKPTRDLNDHWCIGKCVRALAGDSGESERYGLLTDLAAALGCSVAPLTKARNFAEEYSVAEVKRLARDGVTWGMMSTALPVKDKAEREKLLTRARAEGWTVHELRNEVQKLNKGPKRKGGRAKKRLKSFGPLVDLKSVVRQTGEWLRHHFEVWAGPETDLLERLDALSPTDYTRDLEQYLTEAIASLTRMAKAANALRRPLPALKAKVKADLDAIESRQRGGDALGAL
jgi:hypothetical protein